MIHSFVESESVDFAPARVHAGLFVAGGEPFGAIDALGVERVPLVIFDTASGRHALRAPALDYLSSRSTAIAPGTRPRLFFLRADEIDWVEAAGNYVRLHIGSVWHLLRETMTAMEARPDPEKFFRIHRSRIVNIDASGSAGVAERGRTR